MCSGLLFFCVDDALHRLFGPWCRGEGYICDELTSAVFSVTCRMSLLGRALNGCGQVIFGVVVVPRTSTCVANG